MKKAILLILVLVVGYQGWHIWSSRRPKPLLRGSYIIVYGRETCGITRDFMNGLGRTGAPFTFKDVDDKSVQTELFSRMRSAGMATGSFGLPVVNVNGMMLIQPPVNRVLELCGRPQMASAASAPSGNNKTCALKTTPPLKTNANTPPKGPLEVSGITMGEPALAIVGNDVVKVGDKVGVYEVREILADSVKFRDAEGNVLTQNLNQD